MSMLLAKVLYDFGSLEQQIITDQVQNWNERTIIFSVISSSQIVSRFSFVLFFFLWFFFFVYIDFFSFSLDFFPPTYLYIVVSVVKFNRPNVFNQIHCLLNGFINCGQEVAGTTGNKKKFEVINSVNV
jgi:hypothetical protein